MFSILSVTMGLIFTVLGALHYSASGAWVEVLGCAVVALLSFLAAAERLSHRPAFLVAALLGGWLWWTAEPVSLDLEDPAARRELGLAVATAWTLLLAFVAQRVSARRLIQGA